MRGTMLWFNEEKNLGSILTAEGERLSVDGSRFAEGKGPLGRCAGLHVTFEASGSPGKRWAEGVEFLAAADPRRARAHHSAYRGRH